MGKSRQDFAKQYKLPKQEAINIVGKVRVMENKDVKEVLRLYKLETAKYPIYYEFNEEEIAYNLLPRDNLI
jgi:hypothetical protein